MTRFLTAVVSIVPLLAQAQVMRDRLEKAKDRQELRQDARERRDDRHDAMKLETLLAQIDSARQRNDVAALARIDEELRALVQTEIAESKVELARDRAEVRADNRELRSDRREIRRDVRAKRPLALANDVHDKRDDRRDRRDDVRDARVEEASLARTQAIAAELSGLYGKQDAPSLDRKRTLVLELVSLGRAQRVQNVRERAEDKRELREDRRELREDRRSP